MLNGRTELSVREEKEIESIINLIGEPLLKNKLSDIYLSKTPKFRKEILKEQIKNLNQELEMLELNEND
ncbi:hypothetical protein LJR015_000968 [Peribacillus frigoritolerans]|uniref:hypothetical protein n=1 Tax=Peribacillus frigoritolerans TaxID=450367 RepID=UPI003ECF8C0B